MTIILDIHVENEILKIYGIRFIQFKGKGRRGKRRGKRWKGTGERKREGRGQRRRKKRRRKMRRREVRHSILAICCGVLHVLLQGFFRISPFYVLR
jgi:hypothetical protein